MLALLGTYSNSLDDKGRVAIPAKFRNALAPESNDRLFITRGLGDNIAAYPKPEWERYVNALLQYNKLDEITKAKMFRQVMGRASEVMFDKQGRINIPQDLLEHAKLDKSRNVKIVGVGKYLEIWNSEYYAKEAGPEEKLFQETMGSINLSLNYDNDGLD
jgi:MraZ protein